MRLLGAEVHFEKWDHTAHLLDISKWLCSYEVTDQGDHKVWFGPFHLSVYIEYLRGRNRRDTVNDKARTGPPKALV